MADSLRDSRVDCVLADVPLHSVVISTQVLILLQSSSELLINMREIPRARNDLATSAHRLGVRRHHANGSDIVQNIFRAYCLSADAGFCKSDVLWDVLR